MYKRRDWLYLHGADGGGSDTSSSSSSEGGAGGSDGEGELRVLLHRPARNACASPRAAAPRRGRQQPHGAGGRA